MRESSGRVSEGGLEGRDVAVHPTLQPILGNFIFQYGVLTNGIQWLVCVVLGHQSVSCKWRDCQSLDLTSPRYCVVPHVVQKSEVVHANLMHAKMTGHWQSMTGP